MLILGKIGGPMSKMLADNAGQIKGMDIYNAYSGNFAIEQTLYHKGHDGKIHSNDMSIYASAIGNYLAGQDMQLELVEPQYSWILPYIETSIGKAATIMLLTELLKYSRLRNVYEKRMYDAYINGWESMYTDTIKRIEDASHSLDKLSRFTSQTADDFIKLVPEDAIAIVNLPKPKVNYIREYASVDALFSWDKPDYKPQSIEAWTLTVDSVAKKNYIIFSEIELDLPVVAFAQKGRTGGIRMYSNVIERPHVVKSRLNYNIPNFKVITPDTDITRKSKIKIVKDRWHCINYYRNIYLAKGIAFVDGRLNLLVFLDENLIGCLIYSPEDYPQAGQESGIYQLSDFVTGKHKYPRLSKLILMVTQTREVKQLIDREFMQDTKIITSTAFTEKTGSMKYRGVYELANRKEGFVNYETKTGMYTLKQALSIWIDKYAKDIQ